MSRTTLFTGLSGLAAIGILLLFLWSQNDGPAAPEEGGEPGLPKSLAINRPLVIKQLSYTTVDEYGLDNILEADELEVRPRRFMAFNLRSVNEAIMRNAHLSVYTRDRRESGNQFFGFESALPLTGSGGGGSGRSRVLGLVTRLVIETITMELFRDERKIMVLEAATGLIEKKKDSIKFFNGTLQDIRSKRFVKAGKILWDRKREVFVIPGQYVLSAPSGSVAGRSIEIDLDFVISPYGHQSDSPG